MQSSYGESLVQRVRIENIVYNKKGSKRKDCHAPKKGECNMYIYVVNKERWVTLLVLILNTII